MNIRELIAKLLDIDVETDNLEALQACPEKYAATEEEVELLKDLFLMMEYLDQEEVEAYEIY